MANKKFDVFLKGELVDLVVLDEEVVKETNWYRWFNNEETTKNMQKHYFPNTIKLQLEFLDNLRNDRTRIQLGIVKKDKGYMVGVISIQNINFIDRNAEIAIVIGEAAGRKLIYAQEAMKLMIEHGFYALNLHKIYSGHQEPLEPWGQFLKKRFGFREEGIRREHVFKNGKYINIYQIGLLRRDYEKMRGK